MKKMAKLVMPKSVADAFAKFAFENNIATGVCYSQDLLLGGITVTVFIAYEESAEAALNAGYQKWITL
jgi:hypothetical protein